MEETYLLTGATDGIGKALAFRWRQRGQRAFLHGRREQESFVDSEAELFSADRYIRADLARSTGPERIAGALEALHIDALDVLVLNAGAGFVGPLETQSATNIQELIRVNLLAPMRLTQLLLPALRRASGRVVYVSSVVSALPMPDFAVYAATKAAAEGFFRSLRAEQRGAVEVQVLRPGAVKTSLHAKSGADLGSIGWSSFPPADDVAQALDACLRGGPRWRTIGRGNRALWALGRGFPGLVDRLQARRAR